MPKEHIITPRGDEKGRIDGGVLLSAYAPLDPSLSSNPRFSAIGSVDLFARLNRTQTKIIERFLAGPLEDSVHLLPAAYWNTRTPSEYWKARHFATYQFEDEGHSAKLDPRAVLLGTIKRSHWAYRLYNPSWDEIVECYNGTAAFDLGLEGFEVRLDHTSPYKRCGPAFHEHIHLDGILAFHVYHKEKRVMTIGFSFAEDRSILIQQIQLASRTGNRWLYRFPKNRIEFILERFAAAYPTHNIHLINGSDLCRSILGLYERNIHRIEDYHARFPSESTGGEDPAADQKAKAAFFRNDRARIEAFYNNTGRYTRGEVAIFHDMQHNLMIRRKAA